RDLGVLDLDRLPEEPLRILQPVELAMLERGLAQPDRIGNAGGVRYLVEEVLVCQDGAVQTGHSAATRGLDGELLYQQGVGARDVVAKRAEDAGPLPVDAADVLRAAIAGNRPETPIPAPDLEPALAEVRLPL